jgi:hypothetical protein
MLGSTRGFIQIEQVRYSLDSKRRYWFWPFCKFDDPKGPWSAHKSPAILDLKNVRLVHPAAEDGYGDVTHIAERYTQIKTHCGRSYWVEGSVDEWKAKLDAETKGTP